jgi:hypothetical protein
MKPGNPNLLEHSEPWQTCTGIVLPLPLPLYSRPALLWACPDFYLIDAIRPPYSTYLKNGRSRNSSPFCTFMTEQKPFDIYTKWCLCPPIIQLHTNSEQLNSTHKIACKYFLEINRKMYSKIYFLYKWHSTCARQHKNEMFDQMLKYRYNDYRINKEKKLMVYGFQWMGLKSS